MCDPSNLQNALGLHSGDRVIYSAKSLNKHLKATILAVRPNGDIQIDVKPNHWMSVEEQKEKIIKVRLVTKDESEAAMAEGSTKTMPDASPLPPEVASAAFQTCQSFSRVPEGGPDDSMQVPREVASAGFQTCQSSSLLPKDCPADSMQDSKLARPKATTLPARAFPQPPATETSSTASSRPRPKGNDRMVPERGIARRFFFALSCLSPLSCLPRSAEPKRLAVDAKGTSLATKPKKLPPVRMLTSPAKMDIVEDKARPVEIPRASLLDARVSLSALYSLASGLPFSGSMRTSVKFPCEADTATIPEDIVRINDRYSESLLELSPMPDARASETLADGTEYFCGVDGELFRTVVSRTFDGDPVKALAILSEVDLCQSWMPKVTCVEALERSSFPLDSFWHMKEKNGQLGLQDLVLHASFVDALNEPVQALWVCMYTPLGAAEEYKGVEFPPPEADAVRSDMHTTYCIKPMGSDKFELTVCVCLTLPPAALTVLWACPAFMLRRQARKMIEKKFGPFGKCLKASGEVDTRLQGENASFYNQVRNRVLDTTCIPSYARPGLKFGM